MCQSSCECYEWKCVPTATMNKNLAYTSNRHTKQMHNQCTHLLYLCLFAIRFDRRDSFVRNDNKKRSIFRLVSHSHIHTHTGVRIAVTECVCSTKKCSAETLKNIIQYLLHLLRIFWTLCVERTHEYSARSSIYGRPTEWIDIQRVRETIPLVAMCVEWLAAHWRHRQ